jgi:NTE family protein
MGARMSRNHRIGVCISGGGFRAAAYGLGALRYLAEAGHLRRCAVVSGVSGGSVAAARLLDAVNRHGNRALGEGYVEQVFDPFVSTLDRISIRDRSIGSWAALRLTPWGRPLPLTVARTLARHLFASLDDLRDLPSSPQLIITATDLGPGRAFRFARDFVGTYDRGYAVPPAGLSVATAVAASAAAPPLLPCVPLETSAIQFHRAAPQVLSLTDGGVYDNLGIEWFQGWSSGRPEAAAEVQELFVVNASGPLEPLRKPVSGVRALLRMRKVQYAQTQSTRVRWLVAELEAGRQRGTYLGITGDPRFYRLPDGTRIDPSCYDGALPSRVTSALKRLRTDFNRFSRVETEFLAYHGYWSTHARYASLRPELALAKPSWRVFASMADKEVDRLATELERLRHKIGIGSKLR